MEAQAPHVEGDALTAASIPCAAEEQMALQSRRNMSSSEEESEGLGRCLDLVLKKKLEKRETSDCSYCQQPPRTLLYHAVRGG